MQIELSQQDTDDNIQPSVFDRAALFGDGFFTTGIVKDHRFCFSERHFNRLRESASRLKFANLELAPLKDYLGKLLPTLKDSSIRISFSRQQTRRGYAIDKANSEYICRINVTNLTSSPETPCELIDSAISVSWNPSLAGIKHLNRLDSVLAASDLASNQESIMYFRDQVISGSRSNIFLLIDGIWLTPDLNECGIRGLTRDRVIEYFKENQLRYDITTITRSNLARAQSAFVCNSLIGIWPVTNVNGRRLDIDPSASIKQQVPRIGRELI